MTAAKAATRPKIKNTVPRPELASRKPTTFGATADPMRPYSAAIETAKARIRVG